MAPEPLAWRVGRAARVPPRRLPLRGLGPTHPAPAPRGCAAPVAGEGTVLLEGSRAAPQAPSADRNVRRLAQAAPRPRRPGRRLPEDAIAASRCHPRCPKPCPCPLLLGRPPRLGNPVQALLTRFSNPRPRLFPLRVLVPMRHRFGPLPKQADRRRTDAPAAPSGPRAAPRGAPRQTGGFSAAGRPPSICLRSRGSGPRLPPSSRRRAAFPGGKASVCPETQNRSGRARVRRQNPPSGFSRMPPPDPNPQPRWALDTQLAAPGGPFFYLTRPTNHDDRSGQPPVSRPLLCGTEHQNVRTRVRDDLPARV